MNKFTAIIPFYNEGQTVLSVIKAVSEVKDVNQIVCVDDGSTNNLHKQIKTHFPQITLIILPKNLGKSYAVFIALKQAKNEGIILMDADLTNVKANEIDTAIEKFVRNNLNCLIFNTESLSIFDSVMRKIFRTMLCMAGCRIIHRRVLEKIQKGIAKGYQLEIAENKFLMENHMKTAYMDFSASNQNKISKQGKIEGLKNEARMWHQILIYTGIFFFIKQSLFFARQKI